jgi:hypothetical protein
MLYFVGAIDGADDGVNEGVLQIIEGVSEGISEGINKIIMTDFKHKKKQREEIIKKWKASGLLDGLTLNEDIMPLFESKDSFIINENDNEQILPICKKVFGTTINIKDMENLNEIKKLLYRTMS